MITPKQEDDLFKHLEQLFRPLVDMAKEYGELEMEAIWLTDPIPVIDGKRHCRFAPGDRICIDAGNIADGDSNATVTGCYGMLGDLKITMMVMMDTGDPQIIKIKDIL